MVNNLFKESVPEESEEDRSKSSQSNDEQDFYENISD